ncbi:MAG TPA: ABC transporter permease [Miltoncostaeales bacterium]|jgi:ABC-type dipeptide/oligopeptide/nickel transport system permease subunit|nr:ABC transporter permease [Miltoncostaeales bacterium]
MIFAVRRRAAAIEVGRRRAHRGIVALVLLILVLPMLVPHDPVAQDLHNALQAPSLHHLAGTDQYGRDLAARMADGARRTLTMSLIVVAIASLGGVAVGLVSAALPRLGRAVLNRTVDIALGIPALIVALAIVGALGPGQRNLVLALILGVWPWYARLARDHATSVERLPFVQAARVGGIGHLRIWAVHVAPHVVRRLLVVAALDVGYTVVAFAGMSYLSLGAAPPTPELGVILREGQDYITDAPWLLWMPALAVVAIVLPFVLTGERLHERGVIA